MGPDFNAQEWIFVGFFVGKFLTLEQKNEGPPFASLKIVLLDSRFLCPLEQIQEGGEYIFATAAGPVGLMGSYESESGFLCRTICSVPKTVI